MPSFRLVPLAAALVGTLACHRGAPSTRLVPVAGLCGNRPSIALSRARVPQGSEERTGALVVRLLPADAGLVTPEGPVRVVPVRGAPADARVIPAARTGLVQVGPLSAGRWVVEARGTGYQPGRLTVTVRPGATDTVRFHLAAMCVRRVSG